MISSRARGSGVQDVIWMISVSLWRLQTSSGRPGDVLRVKIKHLLVFWSLLVNIVGVGLARICRSPDTYSHDILARARLWRPGCNLDDFFVLSGGCRRRLDGLGTFWKLKASIFTGLGRF